MKFLQDSILKHPNLSWPLHFSRGGLFCYFFKLMFLFFFSLAVAFLHWFKRNFALPFPSLLSPIINHKGRALQSQAQLYNVFMFVTFYLSQPVGSSYPFNLLGFTLTLDADFLGGISFSLSPAVAWWFCIGCTDNSGTHPRESVIGALDHQLADPFDMWGIKISSRES